MSKNKTLISTLTAMVILFALSVVYLGTKIGDSWEKKSVTITTNEAVKKSVPESGLNQTPVHPIETTSVSEKKSEITPLDDHWNLYKNYVLGFSIKIPNDKRVSLAEDGNIVFIMNEGSSYKEEIQQNIESTKSEFEKVDGIPWAILVKPVANDNELEQFIKNRYGVECQLGRMANTGPKGIYSVAVKGTDKEPGEGCFLNWIFFVKYHPSKGKVAAWDMGQDIHFSNDLVGMGSGASLATESEEASHSHEEHDHEGALTEPTVDEEMANSFQFL